MEEDVMFLNVASEKVLFAEPLASWACRLHRRMLQEPHTITGGMIHRPGAGHRAAPRART